jgi:hypothetical protein
MVPMKTESPQLASLRIEAKRTAFDQSLEKYEAYVGSSAALFVGLFSTDEVTWECGPVPAGQRGERAAGECHQPD